MIGWYFFQHECDLLATLMTSSRLSATQLMAVILQPTVVSFVDGKIKLVAETDVNFNVVNLAISIRGCGPRTL